MDFLDRPLCNIAAICHTIDRYCAVLTATIRSHQIALCTEADDAIAIGLAIFCCKIPFSLMGIAARLLQQTSTLTLHAIDRTIGFHKPLLKGTVGSHVVADFRTERDELIMIHFCILIHKDPTAMTPHPAGILCHLIHLFARLKEITQVASHRDQSILQSALLIHIVGALVAKAENGMAIHLAFRIREVNPFAIGDPCVILHSIAIAVIEMQVIFLLL